MCTNQLGAFYYMWGGMGRHSATHSCGLIFLGLKYGSNIYLVLKQDVPRGVMWQIFSFGTRIRRGLISSTTCMAATVLFLVQPQSVSAGS